MIDGRRVHVPEEDLSRDSIPYGHAYPADDGAFVEPQHLGGSDYSGGTVTRSNFETWRERFADWQGDLWWELHGGHGTYAVIVPVDLDEQAKDDESDRAEAAREMVEVLEGLENYPLIDEDAHSEMEHENEAQAWEDYGHGEFQHALEPVDERFTEFSDPKINALWRALSEVTNTYPTHEDGGSVYFDVDRVVAGISYNGEGLDPFFEVALDMSNEEFEADLSRYGQSLLLSLLSDDYVARRLHDALPGFDSGKNWPTGDAKDALVDLFWAVQPDDAWVSASEVAKAFKAAPEHHRMMLQDAFMEDPGAFQDRLEGDLSSLLPKL